MKTRRFEVEVLPDEASTLCPKADGDSEKKTNNAKGVKERSRKKTVSSGGSGKKTEEENH